MAILDDINAHVGLRLHCGACGNLLKVGERLVVRKSIIESLPFTEVRS